MDRYQVTFQTWDKVAYSYQDKFMDTGLYHDTYDTFCQLIEKTGPKILEIGCGPGNITQYILAKRPDFEIEAIDVAPNMIQLAKANNPTAHFKIMDGREIDTLTSKFDAIMCGFCMPYLSKEDCAKLIKDCAFLLNSLGILYVSTMEGDYQKSGYETSGSGPDKMYVYYHQADYLQEVLKDHQFELIDLQRKVSTRDFPKTDGIHSTHIIFIARKK